MQGIKFLYAKTGKGFYHMEIVITNRKQEGIFFWWEVAGKMMVTDNSLHGYHLHAIIAYLPYFSYDKKTQFYAFLKHCIYWCVRYNEKNKKQEGICMINVCVIGLGQRGYALVKSVLLNNPKINITAVCDIYEDRIARALDRIKEHGGDAKGYLDYKDALNANGYPVS